MNNSNELDTQTNDRYAPRPLAPGQNLMLTIKVLAILAVVAAVLWGINIYTDVK